MVKAFDKVEWSFLSALLEKYELEANFLAFLRASQASQMVAVMINARLSNYF
jgi:hypothetical protein